MKFTQQAELVNMELARHKVDGWLDMPILVNKLAVKKDTKLLMIAPDIKRAAEPMDIGAELEKVEQDRKKPKKRSRS